MARRELLEKIFENYSRLPEEDCSFLLQNFLSEALESDTIFEWELAAKLMILSGTARETFTKSLNKAIKGNLQKIGGKSVGGWLLEYLKKYDGIARTPNTFFEFCSKTPEIQKLAKRDQVKLMRILRMYDYFMVQPIEDLEAPIDQIFRFPMRLDSTPAEISGQMRSASTTGAAAAAEAPPARTIAERLPVREMLRKYPAVGEQNLTGGQLKLAHFAKPVRPSIKNWIYDYTSQLGQDRHDSMVRMKYIFGSANGKSLSSPDRDKLGIILKSFDDQTPLAVDTTRNEIVFERIGSETSKTAPSAARPAPKPEPQMFIKPYRRPTEPPKPAPLPRPAASHFTKPYAPVREAELPASQPTTEPKPHQNQTPNIPLRGTTRRVAEQQDTNKMRFVNPYPEPGTHEVHFTPPADNIANLRFDKGLPKKAAVPTAPPQPKNAPSPRPTFVHPKNVIEPISHSRPEPKIKGNIVDLKGEE